MMMMMIMMMMMMMMMIMKNFFVGWMVALHPSNMLVNFRDVSAPTIQPH